ncbi:transcriptional regulator, TetR family [delta proteobacterium NaphS2]|nr:transcriptional regulator, TetR family [delta proteobacterium NaphS2]
MAGKPNKRRLIVEAALELIAENGFHGAPTSKIAAEAGVGEGSIYRHFKDKEDLIHHVYEYVRDHVSEAVLQNHDFEAPIREQYLRMGFNLFHFLMENPKIQAFNEQYFNSPFGISRKREMLVLDRSKMDEKESNVGVAFLESAREQQILKDLPMPVLMSLAFAPIVYLVRDVSFGVFNLDSRTVQKTVEACWDALKR